MPHLWPWLFPASRRWRNPQKNLKGRHQLIQALYSALCVQSCHSGAALGTSPSPCTLATDLLLAAPPERSASERHLFPGETRQTLQGILHAAGPHFHRPVDFRVVLVQLQPAADLEPIPRHDRQLERWSHGQV